MTTHTPTNLIIPPAPKVFEKDLSAFALLRGVFKSSLAIWPDYSFDIPFNMSKVLGIHSVLLNDPEGIKHVMTTNRANYRRPSTMRRVAVPLGGDGLFLSEGDEWKRQRRMMSPTFTPNNMNLLVPHFHDAAEHLMAGLNSATANLSRKFQDAALETVLRALFSMPESPKRQKLDQLVRSYADGPGRPSLLDGFAKTDNDFAFALKKRKRFQAEWFGEIDQIVAERHQQSQKQSDSAPARDLLDMLINLKDSETGDGLSNAEIRDQCATMFFAGSETTARLMFWVSYLLTLDQAEQTRIRAEIAAFPADKIHTLDDLKNWPRLRNVIYEAMRLYPPLPHIVRHTIEDDEILGHKVPANTQIWISPWVLHRHRKYWDNPTAFIPDRFEDVAAPWVQIPGYIPFGAGPRICIGLHFAMAEAQIILAHMLSKFTITIDDDTPVLPIGQISTEPSHEPVFSLKAL